MKMKGKLVLMSLLLVGMISCSRSKKCTKGQEELSKKDSVVVISHGGQNQEQEDSIKREKTRNKR